MNKKIIPMISAAVLFRCAACLAGTCEPPPPLPTDKSPIFNIQYTADQCINKTWHFVIAHHWSFLFFSGDDVNPLYQVDSGKACCNEGELIYQKTGLRPHDQAADHCLSKNQQGAAQAGANTVDPPIAPLPYRTFGLPALNFGSKPPAINPQCNTQLNPTAFHVLHADAAVTRINLCTSATITAIPVNTNPLQVGLTPDGKWAIVTHYDNAISFINTDTNSVTKVIQTGADTFPSGLSISTDGSFALVTSYIDTRPALLVLDLAQQAIVRRIPLAQQYPQSVFLSPDATLAWVTYPFGNIIDVVDVLTGTVNNSIQVGQPIAVVFNATGTVAYVSSRSPGSVLAVDTTTYSTIKNIPTASGASDLLLAPGGGLLQVSNFDSNSISIIDTFSLSLLQTLPFSGSPIGVTLVPVQ